MKISIELSIKVLGDFHVGTGTGRGRATDAVVLVDQNGVPFVPGSTIKGLCKSQACQLIAAYSPAFGPPPEPPGSGPVFEVFGGGAHGRHAENRVWFDHAYPSPDQVPARARSGRSTRDRVSGRTLEDHLFFYENAGPAEFFTTLTCEDDLSPQALLLLVLALRRIEALGGQRRRGKGRCVCSVRVTEAGSVSELKGLALPTSDANVEARFRSFAATILGRIPSGADGAGMAGTAVAGEPKSGSPDSPIAASERTCWIVFAVARSPLTLGHDQAVDNTIDTTDFIAGSTLRGALAWQAIRDGLSADSHLFQDVFVRERVQFGPLYPAPDAWAVVRTLPMPIPASFATCKRYPGAISWGAHHVHGVADRLHSAVKDCVTCHAGTRAADGYFQLEGRPGDVRVVLGQPAIRVFQRTAIDEDTQRGAEKQLYSLESLPRGTYLAGYLWGERGLLEAAFADRLEKWTTIRVGRAKSRGQGVVEICLRRAEDDEHSIFPGLLPPVPQGVPDTGDPARLADPIFITLYSDLIALDEYLRPVTVLTPERLWRLLGQPGSPPFKVDKGFVSIRRTGGFLTYVGLPRTVDVAIAAGSTWRFQWCDGTPLDTMRDVRKLLEAAQVSGLGLRRGEGFGRFIVDLPLHLAACSDMLLPSHPVACRLADLPLYAAEWPDRGPPPRMSEDASGPFLSEYRRLFAELAQDANPLTAIQGLLEDPLHRKGKARNLPAELEKLEKELGFALDPKTNWEDSTKVAKVRKLLQKHSGESPLPRPAAETTARAQEPVATTIPDTQPPLTAGGKLVEHRFLLSCETVSPLCVGSGEPGPATDAELRRDVAGQYVIPGTSLAGALRRVVERLAGVEDRCLQYKPAFRAGRETYPTPCGCPVCNLFGDVRPKKPDASSGARFMARASKVTVFDAVIQGPVTRVVDGVGISRSRRAAQDARKYDYRQILPGSRVDLEVIGQGLTEQERAWVAAGLRIIASGEVGLGARTSRGHGILRAIDAECRVYRRELHDAKQLLDCVLRSNETSVGWSERTADRLSRFPGASLTLPGRIKASFMMAPIANGTFLIADPVRAAASGFDHAQRTLQGKVEIPASSLIGVLRSGAERIVRTLGGRACDPVGDRRASPQEKPVLNDSRCCLTCRLFGNQDWASRLSARVTTLDASRTVPFDHVAIDRFTGGASDQKKFDALAVTEGKFRVEFTIDQVASRETAQWIIGLLSLVLRDLHQGRLWIGQGGSKGHGLMQLLAPPCWTVPAEWESPHEDLQACVDALWNEVKKGTGNG